MRSKVLIAMLLAGGMFAVVQAQPGGGRFGGFGGVATLVINKAVQEDLKMTDDQVTKVTEWAKEFRTKSMEIMKDKGVEFGKGNGGKGGGGFGRLTPEQQEKMDAATAEISKVAYKDLGDVLKKEQVDRLKQIDRQNLGIRAFTTEDVATALKLNDTQRASIKSIAADFTKDSREIMAEARGEKGAGFDKEKFAEAGKKVQKVQKEYFVKVTDLLTDEQKKTWKDLTGDTFDVSKLVGGFPMRNKKD